MKFFSLFIIFTLFILSIADGVACSQKDLNYNTNGKPSISSSLHLIEVQLSDDFSNDHCDICPNSCFLNLVYTQKDSSNFQAFNIHIDQSFFSNISLLLSSFKSKNERPPILV